MPARAAGGPWAHAPAKPAASTCTGAAQALSWHALPWTSRRAVPLLNPLTHHRPHPSSCLLAASSRGVCVPVAALVACCRRRQISDLQKKPKSKSIVRRRQRDGCPDRPTDRRTIRPSDQQFPGRDRHSGVPSIPARSQLDQPTNRSGPSLEPPRPSSLLLLLLPVLSPHLLPCSSPVIHPSIPLLLVAPPSDYSSEHQHLHPPPRPDLSSQEELKKQRG